MASQVWQELFGLSDASALLKIALTHPSYANETRQRGDNQRLEFLGDAVLGFCASELLYTRFPDADEGTLTRTRAQLVNAEALAAFAREYLLHEEVLLGRGAVAAGLQNSTNVIADAVEALIAAAYLDAGLPAARGVCERIVEFGLARQREAGARDAKSELQEKVQALGCAPPTYRVVESGGPAHARWFEIEVVVGQFALARGRGRSKRLAAQRAAGQALSSGSYLGVVAPAEVTSETPLSNPSAGEGTDP